MQITIPKEICDRDFKSIPNVNKDTLEYLKKKKVKTVRDVLFGNKRIAKKHYNHFKVKVLWIVMNIKEE